MESDSAARCHNLYRLLRLILGDVVSDREIARQIGMPWRRFVDLKHGRRPVPRVEQLEAIADALGLDPTLVFEAARGVSADTIAARGRGAAAVDGQLRSLLAITPEMIFRVQRDGTYLEFIPSPEVEPYVPAETFLGRKISEIMPTAFSVEALTNVERALSTGETQQYVYSLPMPGGDRRFAARFSRCDDDEVWVVVRDVSARE